MGRTRTAPRPQDVAGGDSAPAATLRQRIDDWFKANASRPAWLTAR